MKKNIVRLVSLMLVLAIGTGAIFAATATEGGWSTSGAFTNGGETVLDVNWNVDLDRETYKVGFMTNTDIDAPVNPTVLQLTDNQKGDVFTGTGSVNVYWNIFSRKAFTLKLGVAGPLSTLSTDPLKQGTYDGDINWQVTFQPKEVNTKGVIVDAGGEATLGSVDKADYATGYGTPAIIFSQKADINDGEKRKSDYSTLTIVTQDVGDGSKIKGNYAGSLTLTVESK